MRSLLLLVVFGASCLGAAVLAGCGGAGAPAGPASVAPQAWGVGKIVYSSNRSGRQNLYVMNANGTNRKRLTSTATADDWCPRWSPDGSKILFVSNRTGNEEIFVIKADGTGPVNLTKSPSNDHAPAWRPNGKMIAFAREPVSGGHPDIFVMNADGSGQTSLAVNGAKDDDPSWSPTGLMLAFYSERVVGADTGDDVWKMRADGTQLTKLTGAGSEHYPAWSPNGQRIAYMSATSQTAWNAWTMKPDGSGKLRVKVNAGMARWSPDSNQLVYVKMIGGHFQIYAMNANGSGETRLTNDLYNDMYPDWH